MTSAEAELAQLRRDEGRTELKLSVIRDQIARIRRELDAQVFGNAQRSADQRLVFCRHEGCGRGVDPIAYPEKLSPDGTFNCGLHTGPEFPDELVRLELEQKDPDPWKHRSSGMKCATCMWFVPKAPDPTRAPAPSQFGQPKVGRCRRHAPTMNGYPVVYLTDWCGDHKLDESKA